MGNICNVEPLQAQGTVVVDSAQSISSENPLQNKVVTVEKANASALCVDLSGNPITFNADSQAVQKLQVALEPIQDLHGYANPWVGGAGKNKAVSCTLAELKTLNTSGTWSDNSYTVSGITFTCYFGADGLLTYVTESGTASAQAVLVLKSFTGLNGNYLFNGGISRNKYITIKKNGSWSGIDADGSADKSASFVSTDTIQLVIAVNASQTGTGIYYPMLRLATESDATFAPYSNECPISGRTETGVVANGFNIFDEVWEVGGYNSSTGGTWDNSSYRRSKDYMSIIPSTQYYQYGITVGHIRVFYYDENKDYIGTDLPNTNTFTTPSNAYYMMMHTGTASDANLDFCINISKTTGSPKNGDYVPYKTPVSCSIQFGQTVYGGTVDFKTGKVVVDKAFETFTGAESESWVLSTGSGYHQYNIACPSSKNSVNAIANEFQKISISERGQKTGFLSYADDTSFHFALKDSELYIANVSAWKTWLASNNLQVCYELATPTELTLIPSELQLLKGYNYITADGNMNISLVPENVIDYVMGQIISAMGTDESGRTTASRAYTTGEYFYKDGKMYKALTSIASGATFTVGTNCSQTTIFAELKNAQN